MAHLGLQSWGSEGDIQPFLALAARLAREDHDVTLSLATASDVTYEPPEGVTLERAPGGMTHAEGAALIVQAQTLRSPLAQARLMVTEGFDPMTEVLYEASRDLASRCDLLIRHHFLHMAQVAARQADIPEVSVFLTPDLLPTRERPPTGMPSLGPLQRLAWWMMRKAVGRVFLPSANALRSAQSIAPASDLLGEVWGSPTANLIAVSPAMAPPPGDWPARHHQTGFWRGPKTTGQALDARLEGFLDAEAPPIYATFGSMTPLEHAARERTLALWVDAARAIERRLIAQLPEADTLSAPGDDVLLVDASPHADVFPRCAAVVHHGGAGTTQTVVCAGVPSVVVPHLADQFFWSAQVERLGVGVGAPARSKIRPKHLAKALSRVLDDDRAATRARDLGAQVEAEDGLSAAVAAVARVLAERG